MKRTILLFSSLLFAGLFFGTGCVTSRMIEDTRVPEITVDDFGAITFNNARVELDRLSRTVRAAGITREQEVNIRVPEKFDAALRKRIYAEMLRGGYTRTIFVTDRKASSFVVEPN
jgi:biopolymer transport protein ExbD